MNEYSNPLIAASYVFEESEWKMIEELLSEVNDTNNVDRMMTCAIIIDKINAIRQAKNDEVRNDTQSE